MSKKKNNQSKNKKQDMAKKRKIIWSIIAVLIVALIATGVVYQVSQNTKAKELYQKDNVHSASIKLIGDLAYQNIILSDELDKKIENKEDVFVYFFSPLCKYCDEAKNDIASAFKKTDVEYYQLNLLEYEEGYDKYNVRGTPAIFHYKDGELVDYTYGKQPLEDYVEWIKEQK